LEQLELFGQRINDKDNTGFQHPAHSAVYHYLAAHLGEPTSRIATTKLFEDNDLSKTLAAANWKQMFDLHPDLRTLLHKLLIPLAGWERSVAREHAKRILDILLKN
jgi:type I restriction enzyme R subunit